jgi:phosphonate transport system permease protein
LVRKTVTLRWLYAAYSLLLAASVLTLLYQGDFNFGRNPWANIKRTALEFSYPSFLDVWLGPERLEYKADDGRILRTENRQIVEQQFLWAVVRGVWVTLVIGSLGSIIAAVLALPLALAAAINVKANRSLAVTARFILDACRAIHTLVFGLIFVGIVGLGPMAGILAIALHSLGSYGKLYKECIETADANLFEVGIALGLTPFAIIYRAMRKGFYPQFASIHLYIWEFNIRDSTVLGLIGAGGVGLLLSEAVSLFQWSRVATLLIVIIALVIVLDRLSSFVRAQLQLNPQSNSNPPFKPSAA